MVTRKEEKKYLFHPASPSTALQQDWQWPAHPPRPPSPEAQLVQVGWAPDLGPQASPTSGNQGQGRGLPFPAQEPGESLPKFQARLGPTRLSQPLAPWHLPSAHSPDPALGPHTMPPGPHSPRVDMAQAAAAESGGRGEPAGRGEDRIPRRAHGLAPPQPQAPGGRRLPQDTCSALRAAGWADRRGSAGRGAADSYGRLGGAVSPARCPRAGRAHSGPLAAGDALPAWLSHQAELCS